jgi:MFS family permease
MFIKKVVESYSGMPKEAKYITLASVLPSLAYGLLYTDLSYLLTVVQGMSAEFMGLVITVMGVSTFIASIFLGVVADIYGRKRVLIIGNVLSSIIISVLALTTNPAILLIAAVLQGISEAAIIASSNALLSDKVQDDKRTSVFSFYGFAQNIAYGLGSFAVSAVIIFESLGLNVQESHVLLYVLISVTSLMSIVFMRKVEESKSLKKLGGNFRDLLPRKSKGVVAKYVLTGGLIAFGAGMVVPLMTFWFNLKYGISDSVSAVIIAASGILIGLAILVAPIVAKKFGLIKAIVITQISSMIFMFAIPFSSSLVLAGTVYSLRALLMNMSNPLSQSMIMGLVKKEDRGTVSGISGAIWRLPNSVGSSIGAVVMGLGLLYEPFFIGGAFYVVSIVLFWIFFRTTKMPEEQI